VVENPRIFEEKRLEDAPMRETTKRGTRVSCRLVTTVAVRSLSVIALIKHLLVVSVVGILADQVVFAVPVRIQDDDRLEVAGAERLVADYLLQRVVDVRPWVG